MWSLIKLDFSFYDFIIYYDFFWVGGGSLSIDSATESPSVAEGRVGAATVMGSPCFFLSFLFMFLSFYYSFTFLVLFLFCFLFTIVFSVFLLVFLLVIFPF
jgi:hypothetical protein